MVIGNEHTWERTVEGALKRSRLDRVLSNLSGVVVHEGFLPYKNKRLSDHAAIRFVLDKDISTAGSRRWIFPNYILSSSAVLIALREFIQKSRDDNWKSIVSQIRVDIVYYLDLATKDDVDKKVALARMREARAQTSNLSAGRETTKLFRCFSSSSVNSLSLETAEKYFSDVYDDTIQT